MFKFTLKIDGQEIDPQRLTNPAQALAVKDMRDQLKRKLRNVLCPEHRKSPEVTVLYIEGKQHIQVQGCCQQLVDMTMQALLSS